MGNRNAVFRPESYCAICGIKYTAKHTCSQDVLNGIDSANSQALNRDNDEGGLPFEKIREESYDSRLSDGFKALAWEE